MTDRYSVTFQMWRGSEPVGIQNFYVYAESADDALPFLDIQSKTAWDNIRMNLVSSTQVPTVNNSKEKEDNNAS